MHRFPTAHANKKFVRLFNMISATDQKIAKAALDRLESFAALTRAHTGFAKLRPPRSHSKQSRKLSSPPLRCRKPSHRGAVRNTGALLRRQPPFRHCERSEAIQRPPP
jgi:hypothetical protein